MLSACVWGGEGGGSREKDVFILYPVPPALALRPKSCRPRIMEQQLTVTVEDVSCACWVHHKEISPSTSQGSSIADSENEFRFHALLSGLTHRRSTRHSPGRQWHCT